jgi:hypothetical protein
MRAALFLCVLAVTACDAPVDVAVEPTTTATSTGMDYPAFEEIDPYTEQFFIALESTGLADAEGESRLWGLGVGVCRNLDSGSTVDAELEGLAVDAGLGDPAGSVVAAAAMGICEHHLPTVEAWAAEHG